MTQPEEIKLHCMTSPHEWSFHREGAQVYLEARFLPSGYGHFTGVKEFLSGAGVARHSLAGVKPESASKSVLAPLLDRERMAFNDSHSDRLAIRIEGTDNIRTVLNWARGNDETLFAMLDKKIPAEIKAEAPPKLRDGGNGKSHAERLGHQGKAGSKIQRQPSLKDVGQMLRGDFPPRHGYPPEGSGKRKGR